MDEMLAPAKVAGETDYLDRAYSGGFERPYGWAWLLALHAEAQRHEAAWAEHLEPLARIFGERFKAYLPKLTYPIRTGTHFNTAFAMILALEWADASDTGLAGLIRARATDYYGGDRACPGWEPGGDEFLSPALAEALFMRRAARDGFRAWFAAFFRLPPGSAKPVHPRLRIDRSDGKIAHLDGVNLSRAWCWRELRMRSAGSRAGAGDRVGASRRQPWPCRRRLYGGHWLATFALWRWRGN